MAKYPVPNVPFVQARNVGGPHKPTAIVLTLSETTSSEGAALGIAQNLHQTNAPLKSYHYIVDETKVYRGVPDGIAAYRSPHRALNILMCADIHENWPTYWEDATATRAIAKTADLVAELCLAHKIRARYLDEKTEPKWFRHRWRRRGGLIVRVRGDWPYEAFINDVSAQMIIKTM